MAKGTLGMMVEEFGDHRRPVFESFKELREMVKVLQGIVNPTYERLNYWEQEGETKEIHESAYQAFSADVERAFIEVQDALKAFQGAELTAMKRKRIDKKFIKNFK